MRINRISIGKIPLKVSDYVYKLVDIVHDHSSLELISLGDGDIEFESKKQNKKYLKKDDARIVAYKRDYLNTMKITPKQLQEFKDLLTKANLCVEFSMPLEHYNKLADEERVV